MLTSPTKKSTFFDSTKFESITKSISFPTEHELSDDEFDEFAPGPMEVDTIDDDEEDQKNKKLFDEVVRSGKGAKTDHLMKALYAFVEEEKTSFLDLICFLAQRHFYMKKGQRKLATVFKNISEKKEKYLEPNEVNIDEAMTLKQHLRLSCKSYDHMRKMLKNKVVMPNSAHVSDAEKALTPTPIPYMEGMKYDLTECMTKTIQRTFDSMEMKPEDVPKGKLFSKAILSFLRDFDHI